MLSIKYLYPGDPVAPAVLLFGAEFKQLVPDRYIQIGSDEKIPVENAVCDLCNAEVGDLDPCCLTPGYLHCWSCFEKSVQPYIKVWSVDHASPAVPA